MITADSILRDLERFVYDQVCRLHAPKTALACAGALFDCLYLNFRKQYLYVPTSDREALHERYEAIWADFKGHNHNELSVKYHLSVQQIYSIIGKMRRQHVRQRQADLFPVPSDEPDKPLTLTVLEDYLPHDLQRVGLPEPDARQLAQQVADYLCATYPGISIRITEAMRKQRERDNGDLFDEAI